MNIQNTALALLIRRGLATPCVNEFPSAIGVEFDGARTNADIIGLAYIGSGKTLGEAVEAFTDLETCPGEYYSLKPTMQEAIGLSDPALINSLLQIHFDKSAAEIADQLEAGTYEQE